MISDEALLTRTPDAAHPSALNTAARAEGLTLISLSERGDTMNQARVLSDK